ncbi:HvfC family RiPP maturation protein [Methylotenera sp. G11]|uniref:HvfC family RiPP maturation protein n=1 Tax=Methylotenera sp. G11 TaxID=1506585 RepID=UPI0006466A09|nr:putative DNA-binding domain-containing protein [Methylotenera sp. G11]
MAELAGFQRYQLAFTARLRDPQNQPPLAGVPDERMAVYEEIVFNNLFESVSACFPVARKVLGKRRWLKLNQAFMRDYSANDPLFRSIPAQFIEFLQLPAPGLQQLPPYFISLCHYEWVELSVASAAAAVIQEAQPAVDLGHGRPVFSPSMQLLNYEYAVHRISPRHKPRQPESTQLLVFRNADDHVKFIELNAVTYRLISLLQDQPLSGRQALTLLANELQHPQPESIIEFGLSILEDLRSQGVIIGTQD